MAQEAKDEVIAQENAKDVQDELRCNPPKANFGVVVLSSESFWKRFARALWYGITLPAPPPPPPDVRKLRKKKAS